MGGLGIVHHRDTETQRHGVLRGKEKFKVNSGVHGDIGDRRDRGASGFCAWPLKTLCLCVSVVVSSIECLEITEIAAPRASHALCSTLLRRKYENVQSNRYPVDDSRRRHPLR